MARPQKKTQQLIWLCILAAVITIASTITIYYTTLDVTIIPYDYAITSYVGINAGTDQLHFGSGKPGTILERHLFFTSKTPLQIQITTDHPYVYPAIKTFSLQAKERKEVPIYLVVPHLPKGNYTGVLRIIERTP